MPIRARSKMISFRLSMKEYQQFREFCAAQGTSSVSELARAAIGRLVRDPSFAPDHMLETRVNELESQLHLLVLELKRVKDGAAGKGAL
jgi:hypothetical protein